MNKMALGNLLAVVLFVSLLGLGCLPSSSDRPGTYPVTGTVTYDGEAVEGATVAFQSVGGSHGAIGRTGAGGKYKLTTSVSGDGVIPGEYKVKIFKYKIDPAAAEDIMDEMYAPPDAGQMAAEPQNLLPAKYADAAKSGFTATVKEDGKNDFTFNMTD